MQSYDRSYSEIVKAQFRKNRTAVWALRVLGVLFALAVGAPLLAESSPFYLKTADGWSSPWFKNLFNQNRWPSGVDLFFNLLLVCTPVFLAVRVLARVRWGNLLRWGGLAVLWLFYSIVGPAGVVESGIGKVVFFPQIVLRQQFAMGDYRERREPHLQRVLAQEKIATMEARIEGSGARIAEVQEVLDDGDATAGARANATATLAALTEERRNAERALAKWREHLAAAEAALADPAQQYTVVLPPVGYHHDDNDNDRITEGPTFSGWGTAHYLGTDSNGRDVLARILYGTRVSLTIGVIAVAIYCTIGTILGAVMGYFGGWVDALLMRFVEIMICFPTLAFILIVVAVFDTKSIFLIMIAIGVIRWTTVARLVRGQFLGERDLEYVEAAKALGVPPRRIVFKHVLPNAIHPMFVAATFGVAAAILIESGLAFLGLGDPNVPSWGQLLTEGRVTKKLWLIFSPGVAIFITVTVLNLVGEGLRDALDPKLRQ